jgi:hypothetical protein
MVSYRRLRSLFPQRLTRLDRLPTRALIPVVGDILPPLCPCPTTTLHEVDSQALMQLRDRRVHGLLNTTVAPRLHRRPCSEMATFRQPAIRLPARTRSRIGSAAGCTPSPICLPLRVITGPAITWRGGAGSTTARPESDPPRRPWRRLRSVSATTTATQLTDRDMTCRPCLRTTDRQQACTDRTPFTNITAIRSPTVMRRCPTTFTGAMRAPR